MGMPELSKDPRFLGARLRAQNGDDLEAIIKKWFAGFEKREDAIAALEKERVPCAPVLTLNEAMRHPHLNERKTIRWIDDPILGKVAIPGLPVKFSAWPDRTELRSARLGEDNERILHDVLEMKDDQIAKLYADGVLVRDPQLGQS
jgi:CoA:oxalate CoA-transferase